MQIRVPGSAQPHMLHSDCCCRTMLSQKKDGNLTLALTEILISAIMAQISFLISLFYFKFWLFEKTGWQQFLVGRAILGVSPNPLVGCFAFIQSL